MELLDLLSVGDVRCAVLGHLSLRTLWRLRRICRAFALPNGGGWVHEALGRLRDLELDSHEPSSVRGPLLSGSPWCGEFNTNRRCPEISPVCNDSVRTATAVSLAAFHPILVCAA